MNILAIIPARGGSKGVKRKNIRKINKKPLIAYTIEEARKSLLINKYVVSTEDRQISDVAKKYGASIPFSRSKEYSTDEAKTVDVTLEALSKCEKIFKERYDFLVLLQPTSPFRKSVHIDSAIQMMIDQPEADSLISVVKVSNECSPHYLYVKNDKKYCAPLIDGEIIRRQDIPDYYRRNGAIYVVKTDYFKQNKSFISKANLLLEMSEEFSVNIDTEMDLSFARFIAEQEK